MQQTRRLQPADSIKDIIEKMTEMFGKEYNVTVLPYDFSTSTSSNTSSNITIINNPSSQFPWWLWSYPTIIREKTVIINNSNKQDDEEKRKKNYYDNIIGGVIITGTAFAATFFFTQDGYVNLRRSDIENDILNVEQDSYKTNSYIEIEDVVVKVKKWLDNYKSITKKKFISNIGITGSGLAIGASYA